MKPIICLVAVLLSACAGLRAETPPLRVVVGAPRAVAGITTIGVTLTNPGQTPTKRVTVRCAYFDDAGAAIGGGLVYFNNVAAGGSVTEGQMVIVPGVVRGDCAVQQP